jgi:hypothetical protein
MSVVKLGVSQSPSKLSAIGQSAIVPARSRMSEPQYFDARPLETPQQRLEFLDECIEDLKHRIADLVGEDADECEQLENAAELRIFQDARYEIVYLMREVSRLRITGPQPRDYEGWIPWAYEQTRSRAPQGIPEPEYDWSHLPRWAQSKRTLVRIPSAAPKAGHAPTVARQPSKPPRKSPTRFWSLKIALRRFRVAISVTRSR